MSAQHDRSEQGRGPTDARRPAGPAPHPATPGESSTPRGPAAPGTPSEPAAPSQPAAPSEPDGSAWVDAAGGDASAWDREAGGSGSAWDDGGDAGAGAGFSWAAAAPATVPDAGWEVAPPPPAPAGVGEAAPPASVWDDDAPPPPSTWEDDGSLPAHAADDEDAAPARRPRASRAAATVSAADSPEASAASDEVAAVAARLAEIAARTGRGVARPVEAADEPARTGRPAARGGYGGRPAGARRTCGGRRRAPASEPPEDGAAAQDAEPDHESVARTVALRLLTGAPKSRAQLAEAMARREVPEEVADRVLDRFTEVGLVDDVAYAEMLVRSRHTERGLSRRALAQELRRRGVDDEIAQEALEQVDDADEEQAARALARKKLRGTRGLDRETRLRRAYGALGRRGYGGSLVSRVVREELDAEDAAADPSDDLD
ncbi:RecX family transcriptional regulator [Cellulomonas sp. Marseille-Q8402]